jgi:hypothetical protein
MPQHTPQPTQPVTPAYSPPPPAPLPLQPYLPIDITPSRRFVPSQPALTEKSTPSTTHSPPVPTALLRPSCPSPACPLLPPPRKGIDDYFARAREMDTGPNSHVMLRLHVGASPAAPQPPPRGRFQRPRRAASVHPAAPTSIAVSTSLRHPPQALQPAHTTTRRVSHSSPISCTHCGDVSWSMSRIQ